MELNFSTSAAETVAAKRSDMVAMLEARKAERLAAKESRSAATDSLQAADGGSTNVARSSDEFWVLFNAGAKSALAAARRETCVEGAAPHGPPPTDTSAPLFAPQSCARTWTARAPPPRPALPRRRR
jgi:hypothetical protein